MWIKEVPKEDGWWWVNYDGKHGSRICPAEVIHLSKDTTWIKSARNDTFILSPLHEWDESLKFGPKIEWPKEWPKKGLR